MKVKFTLLQACDCLLFETGVKSEFRGMYLRSLLNQYPQISYASVEGKRGNWRFRSGFCVKAFKTSEEEMNYEKLLTPLGLSPISVPFMIHPD